MRWTSTKIILAAASAFCLAAAVGGYFALNSEPVWHFRYWAAVELKDQESVVATVEKMSRSNGSALNSLPMSSLETLDSNLRDNKQKALRRRLLAVLASGSYIPDEALVPPEDFHLTYARMLADAGDRARARALVLGLRHPVTIGEASLDPRLRAFFPAAVDIRAAAEAELAAHREAMAREPRRLEAVYKLSANFRQLGRPREALALLRAAEQKLDDPEAFTDLNIHLSWFWDHMARTHEMLGRYDDALAAYAKGGAADERGNLNVSQVLNMAGTQLELGRYEDVLSTVAVFDDPDRSRSAYGELALRYIRGCAHAFAGRRDQAQEDLAYAKAHEADNRDAYTWLLLCTGDVDGAAAATIERLDDPEQSSDVLMGFQRFRRPAGRRSAQIRSTPCRTLSRPGPTSRPRSGAPAGRGGSTSTASGSDRGATCSVIASEAWQSSRTSEAFWIAASPGPGPGSSQ